MAKPWCPLEVSVVGDTHLDWGLLLFSRVLGEALVITGITVLRGKKQRFVILWLSLMLKTERYALVTWCFE